MAWDILEKTRGLGHGGLGERGTAVGEGYGNATAPSWEKTVALKLHRSHQMLLQTRPLSVGRE